MVRRSYTTVEMTLPIEGERKTVMRELLAEFGDILDIEFESDGNMVRINGDLHDYKIRNKIIRIVSGGKRGFDIPAN